jgi:hypothetical protein
MPENRLYTSIFKRKSIRKYDMKDLPASTMTEILKFSNAAKPLDETIKYDFTLLSTADVKNILPIKAPHYLCLYSEKKENYLMNAGFILQQIDLYLSANHLGCCWLGMAKPSKQVPANKNGLEFVIMLAFGNAAESLHRVNASEFNRKSLSAISNIASAENLLESVRLAPSASNSQPWFLSGKAEEIIVSREKLNIIKSVIYDKMNQIDIGIALYHLWLAIGHQGKNISFDFEPAPAPNGYEFMVKVIAERIN